MSATLVETFAFPQPHQLAGKDPINITCDPHQRLALTFAASYPLSPEKKWASQLAHLASQHHFSEYNRLKFGQQGCPIRYVPLSIQMPDQFRELQRRQVQCSLEQCWWPCDKPESSVPPVIEYQPAVVVLGPEGVPTPSTIDLQQEISAAIASPLQNNPQPLAPPPQIQSQPHSHPQVKTSSTHPINISTVIPPDLNPLISSHLLLSSSSSSPSITLPTIFEVPPSFTLDRLTLTQIQHQQLLVTPHTHPMPNPFTAEPRPQTRLPLPHLRTRSSVSEALQAAINSGLAAVSNANANVSSISSKGASDIPMCMPTPTRPHLPGSPLPQNSQFRGGALMTFHSNTSSVSLSLSSTVTSTTLFPLTHSVSSSRSAPPTLSEFPDISIPPRGVGLPQSTPPNAVCTDVDINEKEVQPLIRPPPLAIKEEQGGWDSITLVPSPTHTPSPTPTLAPTLTTKPQHNQNRASSPPPFLIGNLFLSSCPGKKVRLQGPVKGRSGVCRDLDTDLRRMRDLGVGCIVCCLDDGELDFLGAPWPEYEQTARSVGVDVLRIPIPEGLAPLTPSSLDMYLTELINTYTLRGTPVLVHCRGGVGRAGVVACCWVVKLGLCGWVEDSTDSNLGAGSIPGSNNWRTGETGVGVGMGSMGMGAAIGAGVMGITSFNGGMSGPGVLVRRDTMQLVERVIGVVRRRRSVKAVETFEQVKFLVDFVEYLRQGRGREVGG